VLALSLATNNRELFQVFSYNIVIILLLSRQALRKQLHQTISVFSKLAWM
jgi:hypothetical protein